MNAKDYFIKWNRKKTLIILLIITILTGPLLYSFGLTHSIHLIFFNFTRSAPIGMYLSTFDQTINSGDYVILFPPEETKPYLYGRHWTVSSFLLKSVAALPGEQYERKRGWLILGNKAAYAFQNDLDGLPLQVIPDGNYIVPDDKVLLISWDVEKSFDSRYFGPVDKSLIVKKVIPFITLSESFQNWLWGKS